MQSNNNGEQIMLFTFICRVCDKKFSQPNKKSLSNIIRMHNKVSHPTRSFVISERELPKFVVNKGRFMTDTEMHIFQKKTI